MSRDIDEVGRSGSDTVMTLKVGSLGAWHAVHILLSLLTLGGWLIVYAVHAIVSAATRPSVVVTVPEGGRVEYYRGHPHVLMPDEYLDKAALTPARIALVGVGLVVLAIAGWVAYRFLA